MIEYGEERYGKSFDLLRSMRFGGSTCGRCEDPTCRRSLTSDNVTLVTTKHVYRFCDVPCLMRSYDIHMNRLVGLNDDGSRPRPRMQWDKEG